jgi:hypothetical protein
MRALFLFCSLLVGVETASARVRVGTYDNRAVAVAYAASKYNPVGEKMKEHQAAKAAGNDGRVKELEAWGAQHQRQLHRQGFCRVPVDDLLAHVKDKLPEVAEKAEVSAIVLQGEYLASGTEAVDVTDALVQLFEPSAKTLKTIAGLRKKPPVDLDELEKFHGK